LPIPKGASMKRYKELKAQGLCTVCEVRPRRGNHTFCTECAAFLYEPLDPVLVREKHLAQRYGLTVEDFNAILQAQQGACWVCLLPIEDDPCVDHDPTTGNLRGITHRPCNFAMQKAFMTPENLRRIADWQEAITNAGR